jgi:acyl carrier protein
VSPSDVADAIETFVRSQFNVSSSDSGFTRDVDLFESGYVDSVGVAELLEYLTGQFDVEIPENDLFSDDFSSIDGIAAIVRRLQPGDSA